MAHTEACKEAIWIQRLMEELEHKHQELVVYYDSQSVLHIARSPTKDATQEKYSLTFFCRSYEEMKLIFRSYVINFNVS